MSDTEKKPHRVYRNVDFLQIIKYRMPPQTIVSILHRISGALMFLSLPIILVPLFQKSVKSAYDFSELGAGFSGFFLKVVLLVVLWGFMHHLCAGIRFLVLDLHFGMSREATRKHAKAVFVVSILLTLIFAIKMYGAM